jgi:hypothetical protein
LIGFCFSIKAFTYINGLYFSHFWAKYKKDEEEKTVVITNKLFVCAGGGTLLVLWIIEICT